MKKKLLIGLCAFAILIGGIRMTEVMFGFDILPEMPAITPRQKQLQYLKDHEQEIIDFVKAQNPKIESVQIDWEDVRFNKPGMFTPGGSVKLHGKFNNIEESSWGILFFVEDDEVSMSSLMLQNELRVGGQLYE